MCFKVCRFDWCNKNIEICFHIKFKRGLRNPGSATVRSFALFLPTFANWFSLLIISPLSNFLLLLLLFCIVLNFCMWEVQVA